MKHLVSVESQRCWRVHHLWLSTLAFQEQVKNVAELWQVRTIIYHQFIIFFTQGETGAMGEFFMNNNKSLVDVDSEEYCKVWTWLAETQQPRKRRSVLYDKPKESWQNAIVHKLEHWWGHAGSRQPRRSCSTKQVASVPHCVYTTTPLPPPQRTFWFLWGFPGPSPTVKPFQLFLTKKKIIPLHLKRKKKADLIGV